MNLNESCKKNLDKEYILFSLEFSILLISLDKKKVKLIFFRLNTLTKLSGKIKLSLSIFAVLIENGELSLLPIKFIMCSIFFFVYELINFFKEYLIII